MRSQLSTPSVPERSLALPLAVAILGLLLVSALAAQTGFQVVVNSANPTETMSKDDLSRLFLRKVSKWDHGPRVQPIDQAASRPVRASFSLDIHGRDVSSIKNYWVRMTFSGRATPPLESDSDTKILKYVRDNSGAISYVSAGAPLGSGVKALRVTE